MKKKIPDFETDEQAEEFVDTSDLSDYDLSEFRTVRLRFSKRVDVSLPAPLVDQTEKLAERRGISYSDLVREALERFVQHPSVDVNG